MEPGLSSSFSHRTFHVPSLLPRRRSQSGRPDSPTRPRADRHPRHYRGGRARSDTAWDGRVRIHRWIWRDRHRRGGQGGRGRSRRRRFRSGGRPGLDGWSSGSDVQRQRRQVERGSVSGGSWFVRGSVDELYHDCYLLSFTCVAARATDVRSCRPATRRACQVGAHGPQPST